MASTQPTDHKKPMKPYLLALCLLLNACSTLPPAIENAPEPDIAYHQANQDLNSYKNAKVRWGGLIIDVENEQNFSIVQIMNYPLDSFGRPQLSQPTEGRFVIKTPEFLDPAIYTKNSEITVAGSLQGTIERIIDKKHIYPPLILASTIYLWPAYERSNYYGYGGGFGFGYPYYGFYGYPYYYGGGYYFRPFRW